MKFFTANTNECERLLNGFHRIWIWTVSRSRRSRFAAKRLKNSFKVPALLTAMLLGSSCQKSSSPSPDIMARVGDTVITKEFFMSELERRAANGHAVATAAEREAVLQDLIRLETLFAKANAAGVDRDAELAQQFKRMVAAKYEDSEWKKRPSSPKPEAGELDLYYRSHQEQFTSPEKVHVAILFIRVPVKAGPEGAQKSQQQAADLRRLAVEQADAQPDFGLLAQENSDDQATRYRGGDCGWITRQTPKYRWETNVIEALFALPKPGEITPVVRAADGFYIGKLIQKKAALTAPLASVRDRIEQTLMTASQKQARERFEKEQRSGFKIEINEALLKTLEPPRASAKANASAPPSMPTQ